MKKSLFLIVLTALLCLVCALALTACEEEPEEPAHTHTWGEWVTVTPATCTEQGVQTRICECGQSESGYIPALGHLLDGWGSDGTHHWQACTRTGCGLEGDKTPHVYDAENTCTCSYYKDSGVEFTLKNGTYTVTDYTGTASRVIIPSQYKGIAVTSIGDQAFYDCTGLSSVTIPASVTGIGDEAFYRCYNLTTVEFGANSQLTSIGHWAFYDCSNLTSITIPASVTTIGDNAFQYCSSLTTVKFEANSQLTGIGDAAFFYCSKLTSITIPASVTSIGDSAFYECSNLTSVTIPASMTSIGYRAFYDCSKLTSVTFANPNGWWRASSSTATSGTAISAANLSNASTAAAYLKSTYCDYYWKRT